MSLNYQEINSYAINTDGSSFFITGSGQLISVEQELSIQGLGSLISVEQSLELRISSLSPALFISVEQEIEATYSGSVISIEQKVKDNSADHLSKSGWNATLVIGGRQIPANQIHGDIEIDRAENDAALMNVTLIPEIGIQDVESYHGKSVTLDIEIAGGNYRAYTGVIDIPEIDIINETITLRCTDKRNEQLNNQLRSVVDTVGVYSSKIFRDPKDVAEEIEQRLTTTPHAIDFDAYGNYTVTAWQPKTVSDFTLVDSDVYRNRPAVELTSRGRITNKITLNFQYRYERFYHTTRSFNWESSTTDICNILLDGYSLTYKSAIMSAIDSAGWPAKGAITFTPLHESGWYNCGGTSIGWSTRQIQGTNEAVVDEDGNQINDASGNPIYKTRITGATNWGDLYCMGATWQATTQFTQNVTENYALTIQAPQSQTQFGDVTQDLSYSFSEEAASDEWENYDSFSSPAASINYYLDQDTSRSDSNAALDVAIRQARNTILSSHRDTRVFVDTFIFPQVDLKHTVYVNTDELKAKGKVYNIKHRLNISTGEAITTTTLVLSRAAGSASDSVLTIPPKPADNITFNTQVIYLGNHFGEDPTTPAAARWNGMIGNKWKLENNNFFRTTYQEQFIVDVPAIEDAHRDAKELAQTGSYNVEIPNDTLTITFDGKS